MPDSDSRLGRRELLATGSATMIGLLAGCSDGEGTPTDGGTTTGGNGDTGNGQTQTTDSGASVAEERFDYVRGRPATQIQMNPWSTQNFGRTFNIQWGVGLINIHSDGKVRPVMVEDLSLDGRELTIKLPEGWTFWSGDEITAQDLLVGSEINRLQDPEQSLIESNEVVDDHTLRRTFKERRTPYLARSDPGSLVPSFVYEEWYERYADATTQDERDDITEELIDFTIPVEQFRDEGHGSGIFKLTDFNSEYAEGVIWEDHPWADRTNIPRIRIYNRDAEEDAMAKNDNVDRLMGGIRDSQRSQYPDSLQNVDTLEWYRTQKFTFNWTNEHLSNLNVRRAMMCAMPIESMSRAAYESGYNCSPTQVQTGLRSVIHERFLGSDFVDQLIDYPVAQDFEMAREYLERAGYTEQGGEWVDADGNAISFDILTRTVQGSNLPTQAFSDALNRLGIGTEVNAIGSDYYTTLQNWEFDMAWIWHVASPHWHPIAYFSNDFFGLKVGDDTDATEGAGPTGVPYTYELPEEIGAESIDGSGQEIRPAKLCHEMPNSQSQQAVVDAARKLSWFWNYSLPGVVYIQENQTRAMDTENFVWPDEPGHPLNVTNFVQFALLTGQIQGQTV